MTQCIQLFIQLATYVHLETHNSIFQSVALISRESLKVQVCNFAQIYTYGLTCGSSQCFFNWYHIIQLLLLYVASIAKALPSNYGKFTCSLVQSWPSCELLILYCLQFMVLTFWLATFVLSVQSYRLQPLVDLNISLRAVPDLPFRYFQLCSYVASYFTYLATFYIVH